MAMDKDRLGAAIVARIQALNTDTTGAQAAQLEVFWKAIADEVISEIIDNMEFTTTVPVIGVQTGATTIPAVGTNASIS